MLAEYESNIKGLTKTVADSLAELEQSSPDDDVDDLISRIGSDLRSAKAELTKFKSYKAGLGRADKEVADSRYDALSKVVSSQNRQLSSIQHRLDSQNLGGGGGKGSGQYREQVDEQNRMLQRSTSRIQNMKSSLAESEDHAITITNELDRNRKTLLGAKDKVGETQMELKGAGRILNRMFVRNVAQRAAIFGMLVIAGIIILLVLIACLVTPPVVNTTAAR